MTLYDLISCAQYDQEFSIYLLNSYDQNLPIARGTRGAMLKRDTEDNDEELFRHLMDKVEYFCVRKCVVVVYVRDDTFDKKMQDQYPQDYVERWDIHDPKSRPFLFTRETEQYTDNYLWKFKGDDEEEAYECDTMPLICLRCRTPIPLSMSTFNEVSYTHYSYCESCLREGLKLLRQQDLANKNKEGKNESI